MKVTQLNLGNELFNKLEKLKKEREKYKNSFDSVCESEKSRPARKLFIATFFRCHVEFTSEEFKQMLESRIIHLDSQIKELQTKFKQL